MQLDLTPFLTTRTGEHVFTWTLTLPAGSVEGLGRQAAVRSDSPVRVTARGDAERLRLEVEASFVLDCPCDRCLAPVPAPVALQYEETLTLRGLRAAGAGRRQPGPDWVEDDPDAEGAPRPVAPEAFPVDEGLWQRVAFSLPAKLLCRPDCRGLCPRCGADRNRAPCACGEAAPDPRLAVLLEWSGRGAGDAGPRPVGDGGARRAGRRMAKDR